MLLHHGAPASPGHYVAIDNQDATSQLCDSRPVAALAAVHVDEAGLAALHVGDSIETLEKRALVSRILIQAIGATAAEVSQGVPGGGGCRRDGGLWRET